MARVEFPVRGVAFPYGARRLLVHAAALILLVLGMAPASAADRLVLAFGDSLTAGFGLKPGESFPAQLQAALRRQGIAVRVHNAGVSGETTAGGRARAKWLLDRLGAKPDLAIVELGANDMLRGLDLGRAQANLDAILGEFRRRRIPVIVAGMYASRNLPVEYRRRFEAIYPSLARKYRAPLYPFFMAGVQGNRALQLGDGIHPNRRGVAVIVRGLLPLVKKALLRPLA